MKMISVTLFLFLANIITDANSTLETQQTILNLSPRVDMEHLVAIGFLLS
jgi:hypothetical protein